MMVRFLDLTLILLMVFLLQADLIIERDVSLPHGESAEGAGDALTLEVTPEAAELTDAGGSLCSVQQAEELDACLTMNVNGRPVLTLPKAGVSVQRLVEILDACARAQAECSVAQG